WGELRLDAICLYLKQCLRAAEAAETERTQIPESNACGQRSVELARRLRRHQDLAAVSRGAETRRDVDRESHVTRRVQRRATAVDPDPNAALEVVGPPPSGKLTLDRDRRIDRRRGGLEHGEELVRPRVDLSPTRGHDRSPDDPLQRVPQARPVVRQSFD